jgi:hypothetical protein
MRKLTPAIFIFLIVMLFSCGDDATKTKSYSLEDYLAKAGFTEVSSVVDGGDYEFGLTFIPDTDGEISKIVVKLPDDRADLRVTIWDAELETVLRTETIASVTADVEVSQSITVLQLSKDQEYMITFNSNDWYEWVKPDGGDTTYPFQVGNISITGYGYIGGTDQSFPTEFETDYYAGDLSFVFKSN